MQRKRTHFVILRLFAALSTRSASAARNYLLHEPGLSQRRTSPHTSRLPSTNERLVYLRPPGGARRVGSHWQGIVISASMSRAQREIHEPCLAAPTTAARRQLRAEPRQTETSSLEASCCGRARFRSHLRLVPSASSCFTFASRSVSSSEFRALCRIAASFPRLRSRHPNGLRRLSLNFLRVRSPTEAHFCSLWNVTNYALAPSSRRCRLLGN